ncbi:hypothetical protein Bbelb_071090 [Branchiostoma belcheri]|nr:hypothetical protein Bbelb_071090 [Branchiostoma belcheri]
MGDHVKTDCVYKIPCKSCDQVYIGETGRTFGKRLEEHRKEADNSETVRYTRSQKQQAQKEEKKSAVTDHVARNNCVIDWEGARVIDREDNRRIRWIKEAVWIRKSTPVMNRDEGGYKLSHVWDCILAAKAPPTLALNSGELQNSRRGPIYMDNLRCNGDENSLFNCSYPGWTINDLNCSHDQAAGVECTVEDGSKVHVSSGEPLSVDYDPKTDFMYWTSYGDIKRARRDGSGQETIVSDVAQAWGLSLDHAGGNVYWSDRDGHISVARKDGSFVRTLLTLQGGTRQLVLDPRNGEHSHIRGVSGQRDWSSLAQ